MVATTVTVPFEVWRTLRHPNTVTQSPGVALLQAPFSLNALVWGMMRRQGGGLDEMIGDEFADVLTHALFIASFAMMLIAIYASWQRKHIWTHTSFDPSWGVLTFPSCSTAIAALQYSGAFAPRGQDDDPAAAAP